MLVKSYRLARVFKLDVYIDLSLAILFVIFCVGIGEFFHTKCVNSSMLSVVVGAMVFTLLLIASIFAHEMGHVLAGRKYGVRFSRITLMMFGGAAQMDNLPPTPKSEAVMALAGPAVSFAIAGAGFVLSVFLAVLGASPLSVTVSGLIVLVSINLILGVFNLVPAFPLDGGRVLRAAVWKLRGSFLSATRTATKVGEYFSLAMVVCGVLMMMGVNIPFFGVGIGNGVWIAVLGFLIGVMARQELAAAKRLYRR